MSGLGRHDCQDDDQGDSDGGNANRPDEPSAEPQRKSTPDTDDREYLRLMISHLPLLVTIFGFS